MKYEIKQLGKIYGKKILFSNINATFPETYFYYITGISGCGKSTFLNLLSLSALPDSGFIKIDDEVINDEAKREEIRKKTASIYQNSYLFNDLTLIENTLIFKPEANIEKIYEIAKRLNITDEINKKAGVLSVGEKQRGNLLRALCNEPDVIFADEPCASLDKKNSEIINSMLIDFVRENKKTVFYVSHEEGFNLECEKKIIIKDGNIQIK
ncbi:MAG: ATP-binding cassette domain-containing protein [Candidatus Muiribacteriota bacterium]